MSEDLSLMMNVKKQQYQVEIRKDLKKKQLQGIRLKILAQNEYEFSSPTQNQITPQTIKLIQAQLGQQLTEYYNQQMDQNQLEPNQQIPENCQKVSSFWNQQGDQLGFKQTGIEQALLQPLQKVLQLFREFSGQKLTDELITFQTQMMLLKTNLVQVLNLSSQLPIDPKGLERDLRNAMFFIKNGQRFQVIELSINLFKQLCLSQTNIQMRLKIYQFREVNSGNDTVSILQFLLGATHKYAKEGSPHHAEFYEEILQFLECFLNDQHEVANSLSLFQLSSVFEIGAIVVKSSLKTRQFALELILQSLIISDQDAISQLFLGYIEDLFRLFDEGNLTKNETVLNFQVFSHLMKSYNSLITHMFGLGMCGVMTRAILEQGSVEMITVVIEVICQALESNDGDYVYIFISQEIGESNQQDEEFDQLNIFELLVQLVSRLENSQQGSLLLAKTFLSLFQEIDTDERLFEILQRCNFLDVLVGAILANYSAIKDTILMSKQVMLLLQYSVYHKNTFQSNMQFSEQHQNTLRLVYDVKNSEVCGLLDQL